MTDAATAAAFVAAAAGVAAAAAVTWQAVETRRAAVAAEVGIAGSRDLAVEAVRARLDTHAPNFRLQNVGCFWPPRSMESYGEPPALPRSSQWRMSRDAQRPIGLLAHGQLVNDSGRAVTVRFEGIRPDGTGQWWEQMPASPSEVTVEAGSTLGFTMYYSRSLSEWIENSMSTVYPHVACGRIVADDGMDHGVRDEWTIHLTGTPVQQVEDDDAGWRLFGEALTDRPTIRDGDGVRASATEGKRVYYLSKASGLEQPGLLNLQESTSHIRQARRRIDGPPRRVPRAGSARVSTSDPDAPMPG